MFSEYHLNGIFDEMFDAAGSPRGHYRPVHARLEALGREAFQRRRRMADLSFKNQGITFTVYSDATGVEKIFPFDLIPRIVTSVHMNRTREVNSDVWIVLDLVEQVCQLVAERLAFFAIFFVEQTQ